MLAFSLLSGCKKKLNFPPESPTISGPRIGVVDTNYTFSTQAYDPDGDSVAMRFYWGDGTVSEWSSYVESGEVVAMGHSWLSPDTYYVRAQAKDIHGDTSDWSSAHRIAIHLRLNSPPNKPATPDGPGAGYTDSVYTFSTQAYDPDGDSVAIRFFWGDGTVSEWSSYVESGEVVAMGHSWLSPDTYYVRAQAKDIHGDTSDWSDAHQIVLDAPPRDYPYRVVATVPVGTWPRCLTPLPNGEFVYVTNSGSNSVSIIRTADNTVVNAVPVGDEPEGIVSLPDGSFVYVANSQSNNVSVIRTADNRVITAIRVNATPTAIAVLPDGSYVYAANWDSRNVSVIRTADNEVVATVPVGRNPRGVAVLPDGSYVYVTNWGANNVSVIRTADNEVVLTIPVGNAPQGIAVLPDGSYIYLTNFYENTVSVIRTSDNVVVANIPVGTSPTGIAVLPGGNYVYVTNFHDNTVSVIRTSDNVVVANIPVGEEPWGIAALPDGNYVYVANWRSGNVTVIGR